MIAVDLEEGKFYRSTDIINELAEKRPYKKWLKKVVNLDERLSGNEPAPLLKGEDLTRRQMSCGQTQEDLELILGPMAETGKETIGSMGDDTPLAVLSDIYRPLSHFFRQNFSQVTNPPIDPLRETRVMGLKTRFKNLRNILAEDSSQTNEMLVLDSPVMTSGMLEKFKILVGPKKVRTIDCTFSIKEIGSEPSGTSLKLTLARIKEEAENAVRQGIENIILSDEFTDANNISAPIILCTGAVQTHLVSKGLRSSCSIIVKSAECLDTHYFAVLIGAGATAVNAYMSQDSLADRAARGLQSCTPDQAITQYKNAIEGGLLKIISKMGISVISSYRGGNNFEAMGLSRALVGENFPGMMSRISGIGLAGLEVKAIEAHEKAYEPSVIYLPVGGLYRVRAKGERHAYKAEMIHMLQEAVGSDNYELYKKYSNIVNNQNPIQIRDLLDFRPNKKASSH
jgi:glutamate synthase (NADPH/NADH) large chain